MSRSGIRLPSLLLNSVVLVIMTVMVIEIEEKPKFQNGTANSNPKFSTVCPTADPGIFAETPNHGDDSSSDSSQKQHPMIVATPTTDKDHSESDFVIDSWCNQIAQYFPSPEPPKPPQAPLMPKYKQ